MRSISTCPPNASWSVIAIPARPNSIALSISSFGLTVESISRKLVKSSAYDCEYQIAALSLASPSLALVIHNMLYLVFLFMFRTFFSTSFATGCSGFLAADFHPIDVFIVVLFFPLLKIFLRETLD